MAEVYEADNNSAMAMDSYQKAADLYNNDNKASNANQCLLKVATMAAENDDLLRAANVFEEVGRENMKSNLGKFSTKGYFLQCLLCHLAQGDAVAVTHKLESCKNVDYTFGSSRECGFIEKLLACQENNDSEEFSTACAEFDRITPLDPWKTSMLLKAKRHIQQLDSNEDEINLS
mmetsp:Transcript_11767/g.16139  ORF Transcript_11767/g.16139 Transcript_11767/m.16139 type:complete len:175 (-) Transcript_11767:163-687(-)